MEDFQLGHFEESSRVGLRQLSAPSLRFQARRSALERSQHEEEAEHFDNILRRSSVPTSPASNEESHLCFLEIHEQKVPQLRIDLEQKESKPLGRDAQAP